MKRDLKSFDWVMLLLVCVVCVFGVVLIRSTVIGHPLEPIRRLHILQALWFGTGLILLFLASFINYHFICKFYIVFYVVNYMLLIMVVGLNMAAPDMFRWLMIIGDRGIQPSEFTKIFMIICLSKFITVIEEKGKSINNIWILLFVMANIGLSFYLIMAQPSLSASIVVVVVSLCILFAAKLSYKYIVPTLAILVPAVVLFFQDILRRPDFIFVDRILRNEYQINRIYTWLNPDVTDALYFQTMRSIQTISSGELTGQGLFAGPFTNNIHVPFAYNDFIFSALGEQFGFIGSVALLAVMLVIVAKCILIAYRSVDLLGCLLSVGVASMFAFQVFVNVGVATGYLVNTGMPFPFISYGGSSLWVSMIGVGIVINVSMSKQRSLFEGKEERGERKDINSGAFRVK
ncbi:MAG: FtsW/RodA/SpoVE family cell cycle protein [Defluviitaleaceae bacterium]|nr:FtsW/RodA/SpoVE family cell cycle protein [Defluviitaleaceae bacterium]